MRWLDQPSSSGCFLTCRLKQIGSQKALLILRYVAVAKTLFSKHDSLPLAVLDIEIACRLIQVKRPTLGVLKELVYAPEQRLKREVNVSVLELPVPCVNRALCYL